MPPKIPESELVKKYYNGWASNYNLALEEEHEKNVRQKLINWLFQRKKLLAERDQAIIRACQRFSLKNKKILDVGCGTGQNSFVLARLGAKVIGYDFSAKLVKFCRTKAKMLGLEDRVHFEVRDLTKDRLPPSDLILCSAVIEFYQDVQPIFKKFALSAKEAIIIADARFRWPRSPLRMILGRLKNFPVYFHQPDKIKAIAKKSGFKCTYLKITQIARVFVFEKA